VQVCVIANPGAGRGRAPRLAREACRVLEGHGWDTDLVITEGAGHARQLAGDPSLKCDRVLVCGGDGTVSEVASGLAGREVALGVLPSGRGNDLAKALGIPRRLVPAIETFRQGVVRSMDLGRIGDRYFCTVVGVGFDAFVADRVRRGIWRFGGGWSYTVGVLSHLFRYRSPRITISGAFGTFERECFLVAVSNTGIYGGGIRIAPDSRFDDALLDICLVEDAPRLRLLRVFPAAYRGEHVRHREVEMMRSPTVRIETEEPAPVVADGEPAGTTPVELSVDPGALRVVAAR